MNEYLKNANEELKRVDHLVYVSLKYTRTVDVLKSIIERMINAFDFALLALLEMHQEKDPSIDIPKSPGLRTKILKELYKKEPAILEFLEFYHLLRDLSRAEFKRTKEFRRHVTMTAMLNDGEMEINIDIVTDYYHRCKIFVTLIQKIIKSQGKEKIKDLVKSSVVEMDFERGKL